MHQREMYGLRGGRTVGSVESLFRSAGPQVMIFGNLTAKIVDDFFAKLPSQSRLLLYMRRVRQVRLRRGRHDDSMNGALRRSGGGGKSMYAA